MATKGEPRRMPGGSLVSAILDGDRGVSQRSEALRERGKEREIPDAECAQAEDHALQRKGSWIAEASPKDLVSPAPQKSRGNKGQVMIELIVSEEGFPATP